jgi:hypothetical protein
MEVPGVGRKMEDVRMSPRLRSGRKMKEGAAVGQSQQVSVQDKPATQATQTRFAPATFLHEPGLSRWFYGCSARVSTLGRRIDQTKM